MLKELIILPKKTEFKDFNDYIKNYPKDILNMNYDNETKMLYCIDSNKHGLIIKVDKYENVLSFLEGYKIGYLDKKEVIKNG